MVWSVGSSKPTSDLSNEHSHQAQGTRKVNFLGGQHQSHLDSGGEEMSFSIVANVRPLC